MIFADFRKPVKTSELEKVLSATLSELGYKILKVKDNHPSEEYSQGKMVPVKEGIEYEVRKSFLEPKMYFGLKFYPNFDEKSHRFVYEQEQAKQLYGWAYSFKEEKYKNALLEVIKTVINKISSKDEMQNESEMIRITYYK
ncbi:MAG: hypothetical protein M1580_01290 [Candidatus Parvarchaeota archaeon]|nr:hypothetical protein [Candidatus Parvarchaeota archaeon]